MRTDLLSKVRLFQFMLFHQELEDISRARGRQARCMFILVLSNQDSDDIQQVGKDMIFIIPDKIQKFIHQRLHARVVAFITNRPKERD